MGITGGDGRDRTDDIMLAKHTLSQLSYIPIKHWLRIWESNPANH